MNTDDRMCVDIFINGKFNFQIDKTMENMVLVSPFKSYI